MCIALLALHQTNPHFRQEFVQAFASRVAPQMQTSGKVGGVKHAVVE